MPILINNEDIPQGYPNTEPNEDTGMVFTPQRDSTPTRDDSSYTGWLADQDLIPYAKEVGEIVKDGGMAAGNALLGSIGSSTPVRLLGMGLGQGAGWANDFSNERASDAYEYGKSALGGLGDIGERLIRGNAAYDAETMPPAETKTPVYNKKTDKSGGIKTTFSTATGTNPEKDETIPEIEPPSMFKPGYAPPSLGEQSAPGKAGPVNDTSQFVDTPPPSSPVPMVGEALAAAAGGKDNAAKLLAGAQKDAEELRRNKELSDRERAFLFKERMDKHLGEGRKDSGLSSAAMAFGLHLLGGGSVNEAMIGGIGAFVSDKAKGQRQERVRGMLQDAHNSGYIVSPQQMELSDQYIETGDTKLIPDFKKGSEKILAEWTDVQGQHWAYYEDEYGKKGKKILGRKGITQKGAWVYDKSGNKKFVIGATGVDEFGPYQMNTITGDRESVSIPSGRGGKSGGKSGGSAEAAKSRFSRQAAIGMDKEAAAQPIGWWQHLGKTAIETVMPESMESPTIGALMPETHATLMARETFVEGPLRAASGAMYGTDEFVKYENMSFPTPAEIGTPMEGIKANFRDFITSYGYDVAEGLAEPLTSSQLDGIFTGELIAQQNSTTGEWRIVPAQK